MGDGGMEREKKEMERLFISKLGGFDGKFVIFDSNLGCLMVNMEKSNYLSVKMDNLWAENGYFRSNIGFISKILSFISKN
jgi:hypothetical protein